VTAPELTVNQFGYRHLLRKDVKGSLPFSRRIVELDPGSANVHDSPGEALEAGGNHAEALACHEKAVEIATKSSDPLLGAFTRIRDRLAAARAR
jgi:hypothetical protein